MARRAVAEHQPAYTHSWTATEEWNGLVRDDKVKVSGERGEFKFISAHIKDGKAISIIVYGGVYGHTTMRAFYPERIVKIAKKRKRGETD